MHPFWRYIKKINKYNSDNMRCLYQKDKRALPGNLENRKYKMLSYSPPPNVVSLHYFPASFFSLSGK
jgi:hypothetical protein